MRLIPSLLAALTLGLASAAHAQVSAYDQHVAFDNSAPTPGYFYSHASFVAPSAFTVVDGHAPVATDHFHSPPNALRLDWTSRSGGDWQVILDLQKDWQTRDFDGDAISFWVWSDSDIAPDAAPRLYLTDSDGGSTAALSMFGAQTLPGGRWVRMVVPLAGMKGLFNGTSDQVIDPAHLNNLIVIQGLDDARPHTVWLDDVQVVKAGVDDTTPPATPEGLAAKGYDRHVEISWTAADDPDRQYVKVYRATTGDFVPVGIQKGHLTRYEDFLGQSGVTARYRIAAVDSAGNESPLSSEVSAATHEMSDDELMTMVEEANFHYYWDGAAKNSGLARELTPGDEKQVALGGSGFGIGALITGVDRGFITRDQGVERMLKILHFLDKSPRYHGAWGHFLNDDTGQVMPVFGKYDDGADLVETSFMMQGLLTARQYFTRDTPQEKEIRATITRLWEGVEWDWFRQSPDSNFLYWHWSPDHGFYISHPLIGWNETMVIYLLAIASPTHPVPASMFHTGWAGQSDKAVQYRRNWSRTTDGDHYTNGHTYYGHKLDVGEGNGAELFFTQFSFMYFDPRGKRDAYTDYFDNNRNIALISQAYAMDNPRGWKGYGADTWGQSAGVHTAGGRARPADDNGTITIEATLGEFPYTPEACLKAMKHYYRDLGDKVWGIYGFHDGFNESEGWYDEVYMGLNQAPTVVMMENYRTGLLWKLFMKNKEIAPALKAIGFKKDQ